MAAEQFEKMFQFLLEDRKLRVQEFAAERDRLENERRTRERVLPPGRKESCRRGGKSPAAGEERVLPPGRRESCRRGGESPAAGVVRVLPPGRRESCRPEGKSPAAGEERVLPPGRKESCRRGEKKREPPYKRERAREYVTQGEAYARECRCGKAGGQRRDRSKRVHGVKTVEKN